MSRLDLTGLPELEFFNPEIPSTSLDTAEVERAIITMYEGIMNVTLFPGDPVRLFLSTLAAIITQQNIGRDYSAKQNLLRYASGVFLDHIGAMLGVNRGEATYARTMVRFTLSAPRGLATAIPRGTRITPDGQLYFATDAVLLIPAGQLTGDILAICQTAGEVGNGQLAGMINKLVDPQPAVYSVANITESQGGSDREDDEAFRYRINISPESFSTAGPELAYVYWALTAHTDIQDVAVTSPIPGVVNIFVLLRSGGIPEFDGAEVQAVYEVTSARDKRPLTDLVAVFPAVKVELPLKIVWYITPSQQSRQAEIEAAIKRGFADYVRRQREGLGRPYNPDPLIAMAQAAGALRIEIVQPSKPFTITAIDTVVHFIHSWLDPETNALVTDDILNHIDEVVLFGGLKTFL